MGKSSHKSRKRSRSSSGNTLAGIENKLAHLIQILSAREVRAPSASSLSPFPRDQTDLASGSAQGSEDISHEEVSQQTLFSNGDTLAMPARQERPSDPHVSGVYEFPGPVAQAAESTQPIPILGITPLPIFSFGKGPFRRGPSFVSLTGHSRGE